MSDPLFRAEHHRAFAVGDPAAPVELLRARQNEKRLLLLRGLRDRAAADRAGARVRAGYAELSTLSVRAPESFAAVVAHPPVGAWAQDAYRDRARPDLLAAVAAAVALRAGRPCDVELPVTDGTVMLPSLGRVDGLPPTTGRFVSDGSTALLGRVELPAEPGAAAPGWSPLHTVASGRLVLDDLDPFRLPRAALADRLTTERRGVWSARIGAALDLLDRHHPGVSRERRLLVTTVVPMRLDSHGKSVSATSSKAFGAVGMSEPVGALWAALTFAHEIQHAKLGALDEITPLMPSDDGRRFYAPWRDDPRPAWGLLHGVYAFSGVMEFWRRQREHETGEAEGRAHTEFARWRDAVAEGARTLLDGGCLTPAGDVFVSAIAELAERRRADTVPAAARTAARRAAAEHRARWRTMRT